MCIMWDQLPACLSFPKRVECEASAHSDGEPGCSVNSKRGRTSRGNPRLKIILGLEIPLVEQIVDRQIGIDPVTKPFPYAQVEDIQSRGADISIPAVQTIVAGVPPE